MFQFKDKDISLVFEYDTEEELLLGLSTLPEDKRLKVLETYKSTRNDLERELERAKIRIVDKKLISVQEFTELFGMSRETQKQLRSRINHPLPYFQVGEKGKIQYDPNKIMKWLENYEKND